MKYQSSQSKSIYDLTFENRDYRTICPECSHTRKNKTEKVLHYHLDTGKAFCHHCQTTFFIYDPHKKEKSFDLPVWKNKTDLSDGSVKYFESRMISQKTLTKMKVYSDVEYMSQVKSEVGVICFPFFLMDKLINIKYRTKDKHFKLCSNAELIFYNYDALSQFKEIIITEGEIDALTFIENGFDNVVSVPNGANKNLEYLDNCIDLFKNIDRVYLATDQDTKGIELRDELARRIGQEKCFIVSFKECKDANEYFCKYTSDFKQLIIDSKQYPIKGIINVSDIYQDILSLYEFGVQKGLTLNIPDIDKYVSWETGRLAIVTGIPGSGKSEFVDFLISKLNILYGWKAAYFTPENYPLKYHYDKMFSKFIGKKFGKEFSSELEFDMAYEHIKENFFYIMNEDDFSANMIIEMGKILVQGKGIKVMVIDPYNKVEHKYSNNENETQYISRFLDMIITFARLNNVLVILIAHPRKMPKNTSGAFEVPSLYDINGSANFFNKCDYGFTVHRSVTNDNVMKNEVTVHWQKIKFKHLGEQGMSELKYNFNNGRFENIFNGWDNSNWLAHDIQPMQLDFDNDDVAPF